MTDKEQKRKEYLKAYYQAKKDKIREQQKEYYQENKEVIIENVKEYNKEYKKTYVRDKDYHKKYYQENKEVIIEKVKEYNKQNYDKEYHKNYLKDNDYNKKYYQENKDKINEYQKEYKQNRLLIDPLFKLKHNIANSIRQNIKTSGFKKTSRTEQILGCSYEEFKQHLESKFEDWMNWGNYGNWNGNPSELNTAWDIDHKTPTSTATNEIELLQLNHYTNLQPLCSYTNRYIKRDSN